MTDLSSLPATSAPLPWQAGDWAHVGQLLERGQLPHALLIQGPEHIGKRHFALALARLLLCQHPDAGLNCGRCHSCQLSASGGHGDFRWLEPEEKSRVIKIDQIRQLLVLTSMTASFGQRKVVVISPAESMNGAAANALLKSLEEPAKDTYLILVSQRIQGLPATVRSRCQKLRLGLPDEPESLAWLDQLTGDHARSVMLLELSGGRPLLAQQLYQEDGIEQKAAVQLALRQLVKGETGHNDLSPLLTDLELPNILAQLRAELQSLLRALDKQGLAGGRGRGAFLLLDEVTQLQRAINAGANPNRQLLLDALLLKCQRELGQGRLGVSIQG
jgi:DNA polymerase-3 subunit delta'